MWEEARAVKLLTATHGVRTAVRCLLQDWLLTNELQAMGEVTCVAWWARLLAAGGTDGCVRVFGGKDPPGFGEHRLCCQTSGVV